MDLCSLSRRDALLGIGSSLAAGGGDVLGGTADDDLCDFEQSDGGGGPVTACSFNVLHETSDEEYPWESRRPRVTEAIDRIAPDLLGVQEARPGRFADLKEAFSDYEWYGPGREGGDESEAVPVAWRSDRFEVRETGEFWLSETPGKPSTGWDARNPRIATWATLTDGGTGTDLWFCNTHVSWANEETRRNSAELLRRRAVERAENGETAVVTLDLNAAPESPSYEVLTGGTDAASPVADGRSEAEEESVSGPEKTYHAFNDRPKERVDYVLTPEAADVREYQTLDVREGEYRSDHLPVAATFEF
ncbi:endonuclease/exonuclease/phosphatase family protein [Halopelagius longus]|uniref:Metal-dependent hydrolase, endonuclease/exonuclease/phosphatase family n=1 Tax=Halopelagius longus TaxID=1236180 RepID=A0A1H1AAW9_9EURY|nr:endonuclease/exonuclease/phosphatase family protein [Halopelagius longus]RDI70311.1 hypothetical protein DWB78_00440 [Halopelagius longus]SDQ36878.1 Metal-dependent hydrolase, endonuclease/exonuclease/phosphatase family [Halopelagius longus]